MEGREEERKEEEGKREGGREREECCAVVIFPGKNLTYSLTTQKQPCVFNSHPIRRSWGVSSLLPANKVD